MTCARHMVEEWLCDGDNICSDDGARDLISRIEARDAERDQAIKTHYGAAVTFGGRYLHFPPPPPCPRCQEEERHG